MSVWEGKPSVLCLTGMLGGNIMQLKAFLRLFEGDSSRNVYPSGSCAPLVFGA